MALVLTTTLRMGGDVKGDVKVIEEGTPYGKLTKREKRLAKELDLLAQAPDPIPTLEEELEEAEETEAEDSEEE